MTSVTFVIILRLLPVCCCILGFGGGGGVITNSLTETEAVVDFVLSSPRFKDFFYLLPIVGESGKYIECLPTKLAILFLTRTGF